MHSVNGAQLLIIIFFLLFGFAVAPLFEPVIASLTNITYQYNHINLTLALKF